jgi:hypothetical protein
MVGYGDSWKWVVGDGKNFEQCKRDALDTYGGDKVEDWGGNNEMIVYDDSTNLLRSVTTHTYYLALKGEIEKAVAFDQWLDDYEDRRKNK